MSHHAQHQTSMPAPCQIPNLTIGLDLGDKTSRTYEVTAAGECERETSVSTTVAGMTKYFAMRPRCRVVLEVGTHSPWVSRLLEQLGHEAIVANPSAMFAGAPRRRRNDRLDAAFLARQGRADISLLYPITHRSAEAQRDLEALRARDQLVAVRTKLINHVRGSVKSWGARLSRCSSEAFAKRAAGELPAELAPALTPLLEVIADLTRRIRAAETQLAALTAERHPVAHRLQQPAGVGPLTALALVLLIEDPRRFRKSRDVGPYFGLVPRLNESGASAPQLRISNAFRKRAMNSGGGCSSVRRSISSGPLAPSVTCDATARRSPNAAGRMPRSGRSSPWHESSPCCCISCGSVRPRTIRTTNSNVGRHNRETS